MTVFCSLSNCINDTNYILHEAPIVKRPRAHDKRLWKKLLNNSYSGRIDLKWSQKDKLKQKASHFLLSQTFHSKIVEDLELTSFIQTAQIWHAAGSNYKYTVHCSPCTMHIKHHYICYVLFSLHWNSKTVAKRIMFWSLDPLHVQCSSPLELQLKMTNIKTFCININRHNWPSWATSNEFTIHNPQY